jgi:hypothetical protein
VTDWRDNQLRCVVHFSDVGTGTRWHDEPLLAPRQPRSRSARPPASSPSSAGTCSARTRATATTPRPACKPNSDGSSSKPARTAPTSASRAHPGGRELERQLLEEAERDYRAQIA